MPLHSLHRSFDPSIGLGLAYRGILTQYGYMHIQPGGIFGKPANAIEPVNKWLAWLSRQDLVHLMGFEPGLES